MFNIKIIDLPENMAANIDQLNNSDSSIQDLSEQELALQGGKKRRQPAPLAEVPPILIGFAPYSIF